MNNTTPYTPAEILAMAKAIVDAQRAAGLVPSWGIKQHIGLLGNVCLALAEAGADKWTICKSLDVKGLGGNSSQFRQWLNGKDGLGVGTFPKDEMAADYA